MLIGCVVSTIFLFICTYFRFIDYKNLVINGLNDKFSGTDSSTQFYFFLKTLTQQSLCPREFPDKNLQGSLYYPLGIYWISTNLALFFKKGERKLLDMQSLNNKDGYHSLALNICIGLNVLIIPLLVNLSCAYLPHLVINSVPLSTLASLFLLSYFNLYFDSKNYPIQTRTLGYFCASFLSIFIIIVNCFNYNPLDLHFLISFQDSNIFSFWDFLKHIATSSFAIVTLSCLLFVCFRSSQQGSQLLISLIISISLINPSEFIVAVLVSFFLAINIPLYYTYLDSLSFYTSHVLNRRYDNEWYLKSYGPLKYQFFSFRKNDITQCIKSIFSFDIEPRSGKNDARYKRSWLMQLLENRSFIYMVCFIVVSLIEVGGINFELAINTFRSFDLLLIYASALIFPCLICCLRIFQGYGPPFHYIDFISPFGWLTLIIFINENNANNVLCSIIFLDLLICTSRLIISNIKTFDIKTLNPEANAETSLLNKFILPKERTIFNTIEKATATQTISKLKFAVAIGHYQMPLEVFILIISNSVHPKYRSIVRNTHAFPLIDNLNYSFYLHWQWIFTKIPSIIDHDVTTIFFDNESPREVNHIKKFQGYSYFKDWKLIKNSSSSMTVLNKQDL
jgi:hypothetical protein